MSVQSEPPRIKLRLEFGDELVLGPGKAELLEGIAQLGSISAAGRRMKMSYKRAWSLVEEMNAAFREPLVDSSRGGPGGGGAALTTAGQTVLAHFRALEVLVRQQGQVQIDGIGGMLADMPDGK
ncbi:winged helix-turn-helix domain-containing protein [Paracoccus tegillarcae]|uniref:Molybdenum-binding transcriptional regulator n=1 Tax=Paracoccus tegillarcae TaxID=1529068 RepID=A0A2K9EP87_9RHOB|nr:LysR family transcriptional regulator [Paracoccus tegillarcae]AUH35297.1 molybdenum-binding transcriptional regulator [Paracoccus tegillarcae]